MVQCVFAYHNLATGNIFDSPDGVMLRASKERSRGGQNPMIRPVQNNRALPEFGVISFTRYFLTAVYSKLKGACPEVSDYVKKYGKIGSKHRS